MKFGELKSIGHNIADSLSGGIGVMIGVYEMDIYGEIAQSTERFIEVDFLTGKTTGGKPSASLAQAIIRFSVGLPDLCKRHGTSVDAFRKLTAKYIPSKNFGRYIVTVEDQTGRGSVDMYEGLPGGRVKTLDHLGRVRATPSLKNNTDG